MQINKKIIVNLNNNSDHIFIFHIQSNLSLYLVKCFLLQFNITNYKILFGGQDGDRILKLNDLKSICLLCDLNFNNCLMIDSEFNYNYVKMFLHKNILLKKIRNFISEKNITYITSINYGLINEILLIEFNKSGQQIIIEDGMSDWINIKTKFSILKSILYSFALKKFVKVSKIRRKATDTQISSLNEKKFYMSKNLIDISDKFHSMIKNISIKYKIKSDYKYNILILCAKTIHYKHGIENFLINTQQSIYNNYSNFNQSNTFFFIKLHPGYKYSTKDLPKYNFTTIKEDNIPIEFFDLQDVNLLLSPLNTSLMYLIDYKLIDKNLIRYYDIFQSDKSKKLEIIKSLKIKKFDNNYEY